jgi:aquaporin Z
MVKKFFAEFIGTCTLVLIACGVAGALGCSADPTAAYIATALAFGLVIVAMAYSIGNVSGCHINPAVSLAMLISGKMKIGEFVCYIIAQFAGATAGAAILYYIVGDTQKLGTNGLFEGDILKSLIIEVILTFVFVIAIIGVTSKVENGHVAGLVIGLSLTLVHLFGIHFTGTSVNPARSFGPAIFAGGDALANLWVFIVAPLVGGALAAIVYKLIAAKKEA